MSGLFKLTFRKGMNSADNFEGQTSPSQDPEGPLFEVQRSIGSADRLS